MKSTAPFVYFVHSSSLFYLPPFWPVCFLFLFCLLSSLRFSSFWVSVIKKWQNKCEKAVKVFCAPVDAHMLTVFVFQTLPRMSCYHGSVMSSQKTMQHFSLCLSISVALLSRLLDSVHHTASQNRPFTCWQHGGGAFLPHLRNAPCWPTAWPVQEGLILPESYYSGKLHITKWRRENQEKHENQATRRDLWQSICL